MFIAAFVMVWIRYRHIKGHYADSPAKVQLLNAVSFFFGFLSIFGLLLVSSFQVSNREYANAHMTIMRCVDAVRESCYHMTLRSYYIVPIKDAFSYIVHKWT